VVGRTIRHVLSWLVAEGCQVASCLVHTHVGGLLEPGAGVPSIAPNASAIPIAEADYIVCPTLASVCGAAEGPDSLRVAMRSAS
jgi:hypothetical protein